MSHLNKQVTKRISTYYFRLVTLLIVGFLLFSFMYQAKAAIVIGNSKGNITLQLVYDYECPHCHQLYLAIQRLLDTEKDLKIKLYPVAVINHNSLIEATIAITATKYTNEFQLYTNTVMYQHPLSSNEIKKLLAVMGFNTPQFLQSMHSQWVKDQLLEGLVLLHQYHVNEVPLLILYSNKPSKDIKNKHIFIGELSEKELTLAIHQIKAAGNL